MIASWHGLSKAMIVFGLMINILGSLAVVIVSLYPNFARIVARWCVKAGAKMRLVKDPEKTYKKADHFVAEYEVAISALKDRAARNSLAVRRQSVRRNDLFRITYWIYRALGLNEMNAFQIIAVQSVLYLVFHLFRCPEVPAERKSDLRLFSGPSSDRLKLPSRWLSGGSLHFISFCAQAVFTFRCTCFLIRI